MLDEIEEPMPVETLDSTASRTTTTPFARSTPVSTGPPCRSARERLKWDEAMAVQLALAQRRAAGAHPQGAECAQPKDGLRAAFDKRLPFKLTAGRRRSAR